MRSSPCKVILIGLLLTLAIAVPVLAQTITATEDGTTLKQIIIFGRHSIRSATLEPSILAQFSANTYPPFAGVQTGYLTPNGREAARLLGSYFHDYLLHEGLLTGSAPTDLSRSYFRANSIQRSNITAAKFGEGLIPGATIPVHSYELGTADPVFDPVAANVVTIDADRAVTDVLGIYGSGAALASAYSGELSLIRGVLSPPGSVDPTSQTSNPFTLAAYIPITNAGGSINLGGLALTNDATDPFVMQYADGFALEDVAWGKLSLDALSQQTRLNTLQINIEMRLPYVNQVQSSNAASHVLRSMIQAVSGRDQRGAFGDHKSKVLVIISSDYYVAGLAGLLGLHWTLPGYQPDFIGPGGALVFELRQYNISKEYLVRVFYTGQTFDQLRNLTSLTLEEPPATMQLAIPGGSNSNGDLDVKGATFQKLLSEAIGQEYVQPFADATPGVLATPLPTVTPTPIPTPLIYSIDTGDYNGDGLSDISIFRPSQGLWSIRNLTRVYFGASGDLPVPGDYNNDGTTEIAVFRQSSGIWSVRNITRVYFGASYDLPAPGDYNGDGFCDIGIFRASQGLWAIRNTTRAYFGMAGDIPVPGYFTGGRAKSIAVFRPSSALWSIRGLTRCYFGQAGDYPLTADYAGNGEEQAAVFRGSSGLWAVRDSTRIYFGTGGDNPTIGDYDGLGGSEAAVFRPSAGLWAVRNLTRTYFGQSGDLPVAGRPCWPVTPTPTPRPTPTVMPSPAAPATPPSPTPTSPPLPPTPEPTASATPEGDL